VRERRKTEERQAEKEREGGELEVAEAVRASRQRMQLA
jgi:hypothetical protein